jgi:hypothetical protein
MAKPISGEAPLRSPDLAYLAFVASVGAPGENIGRWFTPSTGAWPEMVIHRSSYYYRQLAQTLVRN